MRWQMENRKKIKFQKKYIPNKIQKKKGDKYRKARGKASKTKYNNSREKNYKSV